MNPPAVSVIMPVFNAEKSLSAAVRSILDQTHSNIELIAVNDGSNDRSKDILENFAAKDDRIKPVHTGHLGITNALNTGLQEASARFAARMDADDISFPGRISEQLSAFDNFQEAGLICSSVEFGKNGHINEGYRLYTEWLNNLSGTKDILENRFVESPVAHPSVMLKKPEYGGWPEYRPGDFPEDYDLWLRLFEKGTIPVKINRPLIRWNDSEKRLSRNDERYSGKAFLECKLPFLSRWLKKNTAGRKLKVWGAGKISRKYTSFLLKENIKIAEIIDIDPKKTGREWRGIKVVKPQKAILKDGSFILPTVQSRGAGEKIEKTLIKNGLSRGRDYIRAA
ncbi:MAG: glycosyltransferase [Fibrobacterota bacterium]